MAHFLDKQPDGTTARAGDSLGHRQSLADIVGDAS